MNISLVACEQLQNGFPIQSWPSRNTLLKVCVHTHTPTGFVCTILRAAYKTQ